MKRALATTVAIFSLSDCATQQFAQDVGAPPRICNLDPQFQDQRAAWSRPGRIGQNIQITITELGNPTSQEPSNDPASSAIMYYVWSRPGTGTIMGQGEKAENYTTCELSLGADASGKIVNIIYGMHG